MNSGIQKGKSITILLSQLRVGAVVSQSAVKEKSQQNRQGKGISLTTQLPLGLADIEVIPGTMNPKLLLITDRADLARMQAVNNTLSNCR